MSEALSDGEGSNGGGGEGGGEDEGDADLKQKHCTLVWGMMIFILNMMSFHFTKRYSEPDGITKV